MTPGTPPGPDPGTTPGTTPGPPRAPGPTWPGILAATIALTSLTGLARQDDPPAPPPTWVPTSQYEQENLQGWNVLVHPDYRDIDPQVRIDVLELMNDHLYRISRAVPPDALAFLRTIPVWIDVDSHWTRCMCYHVSPEWLSTHDFNPEKAGGIEVGNAKAFLSWTRTQPWMVLHELAHALHHQVYGYDHEGIANAWATVRDAGTYDLVGHIGSTPRRHYALNNPQEYFAETSEALFGTNDFWPYVRSEVLEADPDGARLVHEYWTNLPITDPEEDTPEAPRSPS